MATRTGFDVCHELGRMKKFTSANVREMALIVTAVKVYQFQEILTSIAEIARLNFS